MESNDEEGTSSCNQDILVSTEGGEGCNTRAVASDNIDSIAATSTAEAASEKVTAPERSCSPEPTERPTGGVERASTRPYAVQSPQKRRSTGVSGGSAQFSTGRRPLVDRPRSRAAGSARELASSLHAETSPLGVADKAQASPRGRDADGPVRGATTFVRIARILLLRAQRFLWTFWRRREFLRLRTVSTELLATVRRRTWGQRLAAASATLIASAFWFGLILILLGPPASEHEETRTDSIKAEPPADTGPRYYSRLVFDVGAGPSLTDPWVVRGIEISTPNLDVESQDWIGGRADSLLPWAIDGGSGDGLGVYHGGVRLNTVVKGDIVPDATTRRKSDLLLTIFSGNSKPDATKRELLRQIYDKYEGWVKVGGEHSVAESRNPKEREFTVSVVFVMSKETAPPEGELVGDILYVPVPEGYRNIVLKTKAMLSLVRHFDFEYLLKADDDSFVCLMRIASMLHDLDPKIQDKVYAGVPTSCNNPTNPDYWNGRVMKNPNHRWYDSKYVQHTLGGLDCFPVYMQGAFYVLSYSLVEGLYRGRDHLECFTNEDVTIGSWLMGVDRAIVEMYNLRTSHLWDCLCARTQITTKTRRVQQFFHNCKSLSQLKLCGTRLLRPGIGC